MGWNLVSAGVQGRLALGASTDSGSFFLFLGTCSDPPLDVLYDPDPDPDPDLDPNPSSAPDSLMTASRPSAIPTTTTNTATSPDLDVLLSEFDSALLASPFCPACGANPTPLRGDAHTGLWCGGGGGGTTNDAIELGGAGAVKGGCGWGIGIEGLRPLREAFVRHGYAGKILSLFSCINPSLARSHPGVILTRISSFSCFLLPTSRTSPSATRLPPCPSTALTASAARHWKVTAPC